MIKWFKRRIWPGTPVMKVDGRNTLELYHDGLSYLYIDRDEELVGGLHQLILAFPGGWKDIRLTRQDWEQMKERVEAALQDWEKRK